MTQQGLLDESLLQPTHSNPAASGSSFDGSLLRTTHSNPAASGGSLDDDSPANEVDSQEGADGGAESLTPARPRPSGGKHRGEPPERSGYVPLSAPGSLGTFALVPGSEQTPNSIAGGSTDLQWMQDQLSSSMTSCQQLGSLSNMQSASVSSYQQPGSLSSQQSSSVSSCQQLGSLSCQQSSSVSSCQQLGSLSGQQSSLVPSCQSMPELLSGLPPSSESSCLPQPFKLKKYCFKRQKPRWLRPEAEVDHREPKVRICEVLTTRWTPWQEVAKEADLIEYSAWLTLNQLAQEKKVVIKPAENARSPLEKKETALVRAI